MCITLLPQITHIQSTQKYELMNLKQIILNRFLDSYSTNNFQKFIHLFLVVPRLEMKGSL